MDINRADPNSIGIEIKNETPESDNQLIWVFLYTSQKAVI